MRGAYIPTEDQDSIALVRWMDLHRLRFSHVPQETYTKHWGVKMKNKQKGVRKGVPDYIIFPRPGRLLFIEMKRKGRDRNLSDIKPEQTEWIEALNGVPGVRALVCFGYDAAVAAITAEMKS
jgi:hypothetical protein